MTLAQPFILLAFLVVLAAPVAASSARAIGVSVLAFFTTALVCHGELAADRPDTQHLTEFYWWMSVGGLCGGIVNALLAPLLFWGVAELTVALILACAVRPNAHRLTLLQKKETGLLGVASALILGIFFSLGVPTLLVCLGLGFVIGYFCLPADLRSVPDRAALSQALDVLLPIILGLVTAIVVARASDENGWNWTGLYSLRAAGGLHANIDKNPLFRLCYNVLGTTATNAHLWAGNLADFLLHFVPALFCFLFASRPVRFSLGLAALFIAFSLNDGRGEGNVLYRGRSYFGVLRVLESGTGRNALTVTKKEAPLLGVGEDTPKPFTYLMHGTTYHGLNYQSPQRLRRQPTTYYHRKSPLGFVMEQYNWFSFEYDSITATRKPMPQPPHTYPADARAIASALGLGGDALSQLANLWSEPPGAVIGLGVGTMASYAHPFQHVAFYEIDDLVKSFHFPGAGGKPYFNYLPDAFARGAGIEIIMGDARVSLSREEDQHTGYSPHRDRYYHFMVLAAFTSDAVPVHLLTEEAFRLYFDKLVEPGLLIVNVSNRHVNLTAPVTDVAKKLGLAWRIGKDSGYENSGEVGHFASEYIIMARDEKYLPAVTPPGGRGHVSLVWQIPPAAGNRVWTDDYSNLVRIWRWGAIR